MYMWCVYSVMSLRVAKSTLHRARLRLVELGRQLSDYQWARPRTLLSLLLSRLSFISQEQVVFSLSVDTRAPDRFAITRESLCKRKLVNSDEERASASGKLPPLAHAGKLSWGRQPFPGKEGKSDFSSCTMMILLSFTGSFEHCKTSLAHSSNE